MAPQTVGDFGVLHRASVRQIEDVGGTQHVYVECPAVAPGQSMGPVASLAPDLVVGERVLLACIGPTISDTVVLERISPRWPSIAEIPGLGDSLASLATDADVDLLTNRVDTQGGQLAEQTQTLYELERSLAYTRSKLEELPEAFQRAQADAAAASAANTAALAAIRTQMFGAPDRTRPYEGRVYWTTDSSTLAANTDYGMTGGWAKFADPDGIVVLGDGTNAAPVTITAPVAGEYELEWNLVSTATTGVMFARFLLNASTTATLPSRVTTSSIVDIAAGGTSEATHLHGSVKRQLAAGDKVTATLYSTAAFVLKAGWFTQLRKTNFGIRYVGPSLA